MTEPVKHIVVDFETLYNGYGLEIWSKNFTIVSASFLVEGTCMFTTDFQEIQETLNSYYAEGYTFLVYNMGFDCTIMKYIFGLKDIFKRSIDVWRLFNYCCLTVDDKHAGKKLRKTDLAAAKVYLYGGEDYKKPFLTKVIDMGLAKTEKEAHAHIASLPPEMLEEYNNADVVNTRQVYMKCKELLEGWQTKWEFDHMAYASEVEAYSDSFIRGIKIDRDLAQKNVEVLQAKLEDITETILKAKEIGKVEEMSNGIPQMSLKQLTKESKLSGIPVTETEALKELKRQRLWVKFNFNSVLHKRALFIGVMRLPIKKLTPKGEAKVDKKVLKTYGELGKQFVKRADFVKQIEELKKLIELSAEDGRWHMHLSSGRTVSGRSSSSTD